MVRTILADKLIDCEHLLGKFVDDSYYDILIDEDTDCYLPSGLDENKTSEEYIAFKFRKNFFTKQEQDDAYAGLMEAAISTENRGLASGTKDGTNVGDGGRVWVTNYQQEMMEELLKASNASLSDEDVIDSLQAKYPTEEARKKALGGGKNNVWVIYKLKEGFNFDVWLESIKPLNADQRAKETLEIMKNISETTYGNAVDSGIAGWFDRYPRIPYGRATSYTRDNFDKFKMSFPFLQRLSRGFNEMLPERYSAQMEAVNNIDSKFVIPETPFTTVTVNKTFRTACHRDAGDFSKGLSNLLVLSNDGRYTGGYLVLPELRIAINIRPGDLLLINNHECIHGNTPIVCEEGSHRVSLVCYLREKMLELGSYEYETARYEYVESRRKNPDHPLQRKLWNGVSEGMWKEQEWYNYLESKLGKDELIKMHPESQNQTLEEFF